MPFLLPIFSKKPLIAPISKRLFGVYGTHLYDHQRATTMTNSFHSLSSRQLSIAFAVILAALCLLTPDIAHASGGLAKVNDFMDNIAGILRGASIATVTVALMWAGYKYLFQDATVMETLKIVIAGLLIGGAGEIARYLLG
ncbi:attachment mediating protein VirB2-like protein [Vibrio scophthalmi LMG 19158]|uniref:Attachment mediating protein VirB2-like protein n=2 Tax=Vibrio scophthalmi TaxID=45658 RepID=F9RQM6_9VIBR|nr:attachment mediating protein VirB2-like protein [Vibrio scophthalmi LMG 19158]